MSVHNIVISINSLSLDGADDRWAGRATHTNERQRERERTRVRARAIHVQIIHGDSPWCGVLVVTPTSTSTLTQIYAGPGV